MAADNKSGYGTIAGAVLVFSLLASTAHGQILGFGTKQPVFQDGSPIKGTIAEPSVKLINFTADWCPNCQILNPQIVRALASTAPGSVERIDLDLTKARRSTEEERNRALVDAMNLTIAHNVEYLWDWYGGFTGIAVLVAADSGEPISCLMGVMSTEEITARIEDALILTDAQPQGARKPNGPDCISPLR